MKVCIIGGGSWATAIVKMLTENKVKINWWMRSRPDIDYILNFKRNRRYLSSAIIDLESVQLFDDIVEAIKHTDIVILAVPSAYILSAISPLTKQHFANRFVVTAIKGMIPDSGLLITDYIEQHYEVSPDQLMMIAGPCHAEEVAMERLSYLTICGNSLENAEIFARMLRSRFVKVSANGDLDGAEYCAIMKNIISVACGIAHGLNYGDNFQAVMVSNSIGEINNMLQVVCPKERDLTGSAYLGDLLVTAYSQFSRNRTLGNMIGRGYSVRSAQMEMSMIAEGYFAAKSIRKIQEKYHIDMPITTAVYNILYERISPIIEYQILRDKFH